MHKEANMRVVMCPPEFIRIETKINDWMDKNSPPDQKNAYHEWLRLVSIYIRLEVEPWFVEAHPDFQDMCFAANTGWCQWGKLIFGNFLGKMAEARGEEPNHYYKWFLKHRSAFTDIELVPWSFSHCGFAGQGDVVTVGKEKSEASVLVGYGQGRTDYEAHHIIREIHGLASWQVLPIRLIDPLCYDLDLMCLYIPPVGALPPTLIWYPSGTDATGQRAIASLVDTHNQIILSKEEAYSACCNGVFIQHNGSITVVMHDPSPTLTSRLQERGYHVIKQPMHEFLKNGGSTRCLSLLVRRYV